MRAVRQRRLISITGGPLFHSSKGTHAHTNACAGGQKKRKNKKQGNRVAGLIKAAHSPDFFPSCWRSHLYMLAGVVFWARCTFPPAFTLTLHIPAPPAGRPGVPRQAHTHTHTSPAERHLCCQVIGLAPENPQPCSRPTETITHVHVTTHVTFSFPFSTEWGCRFWSKAVIFFCQKKLHIFIVYRLNKKTTWISGKLAKKAV